MRRAVFLTALSVLRAILIVDTAAADPSSSQACCEALTAVLGSDQVAYPPDESYRRSLESYWTSQARLVEPACLLLPRSSQDIATAIKALTGGRRCRFAVRSGGHKPSADAANIENGVTIDLSALNEVHLSDDRIVASVGPGARWRDVYRTLERQGTAVVGGRNGLVGVGGLTLGGGISYFSARYGFACDNVKNFEVVLASGEIVNANANDRPDLFQALKGGSNNFGIVTRFDLRAFEQGPFWGGIVVFPGETLSQQIPAFVRFTDGLAQDPYASLIVFQSYSSATNQTTIANSWVYTKPEPFPAPFRELNNIKPEPSRILSISNLSVQSDPDEFSGPRQAARGFEAALTFANRPEVIARSYEIGAEMLEPVKGRRNLTWSTLVQPIPRLYSDLGLERGGNVLGLDRNRNNGVLFAFTVEWTDAADDKDIYAAAEAAIDKISRYTKRVGAAIDWIYLNYALRTQDVIASYGPENVQKLRAVSQKYDPDQVFQKLVPGGYKIPAAPEGDESYKGDYDS